MTEDREQNGGNDSAEEGGRGEYVHGGSASSDSSDSSTNEGQYVQGDYGTAGNVEGVDPLMDDDEGESEDQPGQYPEGDFGSAGSSKDLDDDELAGQYDDGDYGAAGTVSHDK
jgi:hypothetical protein